jgi:prepilin-type processing-associated H-X9-DG protein
MAVPVGLKDEAVSPGTFLQSIGVNASAGAEPSANAIPEPAWYVICADGGATIDDFCTGSLAYPDLCHLECAGPGDWEADWEKCPWSRECGAIADMKRDPELRKPYARHFGGVNIGFLDGHARWMNSEEVIEESPSAGDPHRGRLRGYGPWGPTYDAPWYDPDDGIIPLY